MSATYQWAAEQACHLREDPRDLQRLFDAESRYTQLCREAAAFGHNEPPFLAGLATVVAIIVVLAIGAAMVPHGWLAA